MTIQDEVKKIKSIINNPNCHLSFDIIRRLTSITEQLEVQLYREAKITRRAV